MDYRYGSHTVFQIEYHFVWVTKYHYKVLTGEVAERVRELVKQTCEAFEIRIVRGVVSKDHVHIVVSSPPELAPSEIMRRIKGRTASKVSSSAASFSRRPFPFLERLSRAAHHRAEISRSVTRQLMLRRPASRHSTSPSSCLTRCARRPASGRATTRAGCARCRCR